MKFIWIAMVGALLSCGSKGPAPALVIAFEGTHKVNVIGYTDDLMEPFLTRDGSTLLFNNSNDPSVNTNLHWATYINDTTFQYKGEIQGVNSSSLDGVASMDANGVLYFVSTRDYNQTLSSIYECNFSNGQGTNINAVSGPSKNIAGWLNFDVEVDATGETLYFVDGSYDQNGGPYEADLVIATKTANGFQRAANSATILKNINTDALEYAACISYNRLEFYFTRVAAPLTSSSVTETFVASRATPDGAFGVASKIKSITGFAEAATISSDGNRLYYHKKDNGKFTLYLTTRVR